MNQNARRRLLKLYEFAQGCSPINLNHFHQRLSAISSDYPVDDIQKIMAELDPRREIFEYPLTGSEKGLDGHPVAHNSFEFLSRLMSPEVKRDPAMSVDLHRDFCDAMSELLGSGFVVKAFHTGDFGFLATHRLGIGVNPVAEDLRTLSVEYCLEIEPFAWLQSPRSLYYQDEKHLAVTAFLPGDSAIQVPHLVHALVDRFRALEIKWKEHQR